MFRRLKNILKETGILLLAASLLISVAAGQTRKVAVVNTPNVKVVNTPTVNVGNTANVNVTNTPAVQVSGTASVNVKNDSSAPVIMRSTDEPARQPFLLTSFFDIPDSSSLGTVDFQHFVVPRGKELVIEYVDVKLNPMPSGTVIDFDLNNVTNRNQTLHSFPAISIANVTGTIFLMREQVRLYSDPGTPIVMNVFLNGSHSGTRGLANISGYLVDVQ